MGHDHHMRRLRPWGSSIQGMHVCSRRPIHERARLYLESYEMQPPGQAGQPAHGRVSKGASPRRKVDHVLTACQSSAADGHLGT